MRIVFFVSMALGLCAAAWVSAAQVDDRDDRTIWDGVFTREQAAHGEEIYEIACGHCHAEDLGGGEGPALVGALFTRNWFEESLQSLFSYILETMPADLPGSLSDDQAVALTGFLLSANGVPSGPLPLEPNADLLTRILIIGEDGPGSVPNFSVVQVVGCLSRLDGDWVLTRSTEPSRARDGAASTSEAKAMATGPLGTDTLEFMDAAYQDPESLDGQKVLVKGLLIRQPMQVKINVTGLAGTGVPCEA